MRNRKLSAFVLVGALLVAACGDDAPDSSEPPIVVDEGPTLTVSPNPTAPLAAVVHANTTEPTILELTIDDGATSWVVVPDPSSSTEHEVPVLGLTADTEHVVTVSAVAESGAEAVIGEFSFVTPKLPDLLDDVAIVQPATPASEPGVTMFGARHATEDASGTFLVIVDGDGDIVWYYDDDIGISDSRRLRNGNLLFLHSGNRGAREIDMLGNVVGEWTATGWDRELPEGSVGVATDSFHHEIVELPDDDIADFLVLSTELRPFSDYPLDVADPSQTEDGDVGVLGDTIVTFDRDGTIVEEWSLLDILDPYRVSYDALGTDWTVVYDGEDTRDWSHANAVVLDPADGNLVVSLRNQDAVVKIDRGSGELMWILGDHDGWDDPWSDTLLDPVDDSGAFEWSYHQHAPMFTPDGTIVLFDNGNGRAVPPEPELDPDDRYSRAVEYLVDERAGTVRQVWSYGSPDDAWYSGALGDADHLSDTGNVLVADGFRNTDDDGRWARVFEVSRTDPGEVVWEIAAGGGDVDWTIYRAERLGSVYPDGHGGDTDQG